MKSKKNGEKRRKSQQPQLLAKNIYIHFFFAFFLAATNSAQGQQLPSWKRGVAAIVQLVSCEFWAKFLGKCNCAAVCATCCTRES